MLRLDEVLETLDVESSSCGSVPVEVETDGALGVGGGTGGLAKTGCSSHARINNSGKQGSEKK